MDTAGTIKPITGKRRKTRSAVSMEAQDHADAADGTSDNDSARSRSTPPVRVFSALSEKWDSLQRIWHLERTRRRFSGKMRHRVVRFSRQAAR